MSQGQLRDRKACACRYASCTSISTRREDVVAHSGVDELAEPRALNAPIGGLELDRASVAVRWW
jgi:hypothetical protein